MRTKKLFCFFFLTYNFVFFWSRSPVGERLPLDFSFSSSAGHFLGVNRRSTSKVLSFPFRSPSSVAVGQLRAPFLPHKITHLERFHVIVYQFSLDRPLTGPLMHPRLGPAAAVFRFTLPDTGDPSWAGPLYPTLFPPGFPIVPATRPF